MAATMTPPETPTTEVAKQSSYDPLAPVGSSIALKQILETQIGSLRQAMPKHVTPERVMKTMLVAANRTPDLLNCTRASILETISRAGELGLDLSGTLGEAYPVPFNNKVKYVEQETGKEKEGWFKQCTLIIGYRGLIKLARQSGEVTRVEANVIHENDHFECRYGLNGSLEFEKSREDRGDVFGAYALVQMRDGSAQYDFMTKAEIEAIREKAISKKSPAWRDHWGEMAKKTVLRRVLKLCPLSTERFQEAIEHDNQQFNDGFDVVYETTERGTRTESLVQRLQGDDAESSKSDSQPEPTAEPDRDELITQLMEVTGCSAEAAAKRIAGALKLFDKPLSKLNKKEREDIAARIASGDIVPD